MIKFFVILSVFLFYNLATAQNNQIVLNWGAQGLSEGGADALQLSTGSIFHCGFANVAPNQSRVNVSKISTDGEIVESWFFGPDGRHVPHQMRWVNSTLVITGQSEFANGNFDGFWLRIDTLGNELHWSNFGLQNRTEIFQSFDIDAQGDFVVCGVAGADNGLWNNTLVMKFNNEFAPQWLRTSDYPDNNLGLSIQVIDGTEYVVCGDRRVEGTYYNIFLTRYDTSGEEIWTYFSPNGYNGGSKAVTVNSNNEIIVVGESSGPGFDVFEMTFARFTDEGEPIVQAYIEGQPQSDAAFAVIERIPGSYLIAGYGYNPETFSIDAVVVYTDENANEISRRFYHLTSNNDIIFSITPGAEQGFILAGKAGSDDEGHLLIYDQIPLTLNINEPNAVEEWSTYPNPLSIGEPLWVQHHWHSASLHTGLGKWVKTFHRNDDIIINTSGLNHLQFYDQHGRILARSKVIAVN